MPGPGNSAGLDKKGFSACSGDVPENNLQHALKRQSVVGAKHVDMYLEDKQRM